MFLISTPGAYSSARFSGEARARRARAVRLQVGAKALAATLPPTPAFFSAGGLERVRVARGCPREIQNTGRRCPGLRQLTDSRLGCSAGHVRRYGLRHPVRIYAAGPGHAGNSEASGARAPPASPTSTDLEGWTLCGWPRIPAPCPGRGRTERH